MIIRRIEVGIHVDLKSGFLGHSERVEKSRRLESACNVIRIERLVESKKLPEQAGSGKAVFIVDKHCIDSL